MPGIMQLISYGAQDIYLTEPEPEPEEEKKNIKLNY
jgi:hypothetical protein